MKMIKIFGSAKTTSWGGVSHILHSGVAGALFLRVVGCPAHPPYHVHSKSFQIDDHLKTPNKLLNKLRELLYYIICPSMKHPTLSIIQQTGCFFKP